MCWGYFLPPHLALLPPEAGDPLGDVKADLTLVDVKADLTFPSHQTENHIREERWTSKLITVFVGERERERLGTTSLSLV